MKSHPDADGFVRAILANPSDPTPRLVFADWLDDTGRPGNAAWAEYIRLRAEMDDVRGRLDWFHEAKPAVCETATRIVANLKMPATVAVDRLPWLFDLLPPWCITVDLDQHDIPRSVIELVPESVARENALIPVRLLRVPPFRCDALVFAAAHATNAELAQKVGFILNRRVLFLAATGEGLERAIALNYGVVEIDHVDSPPMYPPFDFPDTL